MEEFDGDYTAFAPQNREADKNLLVKFFTQPVKNEAKSAEAGRLICDDVEMIEIRTRGDRNNIVIHPVRPEEKKRFRDAYRDFKEGSNTANVGTPLTEWPLMAASTVEEMKYLGFFTVEQISEANDDICGKIAGLTMFKQKAKLWIESAKDQGAPIETLTLENRDLKSQLEMAQQQIAKMAADIAKLQKEQPAQAAQAAQVAAVAKTK